MRPRWLLNENFPAPAVARLRASGWDILAYDGQTIRRRPFLAPLTVVGLEPPWRARGETDER